MKTNNGPYCSLELDQDETEYLAKLLRAARKLAEMNFIEMCNMPSSDERARFRSMLTLAATADKAMTDCLMSKVHTGSMERADDAKPLTIEESEQILAKFKGICS